MKEQVRHSVRPTAKLPPPLGRRATLGYPGTADGPRPRARTRLERLVVPQAMVAIATTVLTESLGLRGGERLGLVFDIECARIARAFDLAAAAMLVEVVAVGIDPLADANTEAAHGIDVLADTEVSVIVLADAPYPGTPFGKLAAYAPTRRRALLFDVRDDAFAHVLAGDVVALERAATSLHEALSRARTLRLIGGPGHALEATLGGPMRVTVENGRTRADRPTALLPAGLLEAQGLFPTGKCVAKGGVVLGGGARVGMTSPLELVFDYGRVVDVQGRDAERLTSYFSARPETRHASHVGFGLNASLRVPIGAMQDLRIPGAHLVLGAHPSRPSWQSPDAVHVLLRDVGVAIDGREVSLTGAA